MRKCAGSLSPLSTENQATGILCLFTQSANRVVFPKPAGADMSVSLRSNPSAIRLTNRDRVTHLDPCGGTHSFVLKGVRCCIASHLSFIPGDEPPEEPFLVNDLAFKISVPSE